METLLRELDEAPTIEQASFECTRPVIRIRANSLTLNDSQQQRLAAQIRAVKLIQHGQPVPAEMMVNAGGLLESVCKVSSRFRVPADRGGKEEWYRQAARPDFWALPSYLLNDISAGGDLSAIYEDEDEELRRRMQARISGLSLPPLPASPGPGASDPAGAASQGPPAWWPARLEARQAGLLGLQRCVRAQVLEQHPCSALPSLEVCRLLRRPAAPAPLPDPA